jgi:phosphotriesterase-related protein
MSGLWPVGEVMTVCGPVPSASLGLTSMHDHLFCDVGAYRHVEVEALAAHGGADVPFELSTRSLINDEAPFLSTDNCLLDDRQVMTAEVAEFHGAGGRTMLELSCWGLRTDVVGIRELALQTGVNVVIGTGFYIAASWPAWATAMDEVELEELMVTEIEAGVGDTGVQAGHIGEIGVTDLGAQDQRALRAAARAAVRTGVAVSVHPGWDDSCDGRMIAPILLGEGLPAERIIIAHGDAFLVEHDLHRLVTDPENAWRLQTEYHEELLSQGLNISVDCFGHDWNIGPRAWRIETDVHRLAGVYALLERGYADQLVLGTDVCFKMLTGAGGGRGYRHLTSWVLPTLRDVGVEQAVIDKLTVENPARLLSRVES